MSLRAFHIFLITAALGFFIFLLLWAGRRYAYYGAESDLALALAAFAGLVVGFPYLYWFLRKGGDKGQG